MDKHGNSLGLCKELIEAKLSWGNSATWQNHDFDVLCTKIFEETKVSLSTSTLKRIWGKVEYTSTPNVATLNALAQFAGYTNWREFMAKTGQSDSFETSNNPDIEKRNQSNSKPPVTIKGNLKFTIAVTLTLVLGVSFFVLFPNSKGKNKSLKFNDLKFASKHASIGLPNSVVFKYDVVNSNADSVFIQQSWDKNLRFKVDKNKHEFVCTYYYPGYYNAKLLLNDSTVKQHDLFVETNGWLGTIDKEPIPIYFKENELLKNGTIEISRDQVVEKGIDVSKSVPWVSLYRVDSSLQVSSKNFVLEVEVKNTFQDGDGVCQLSKIILMGSSGFSMIPLSIKGCIGELDFVLANEKMEGTTNDLSGFGVAFDNWVGIRLEVKDNYARIFINKQLIFQGKQQNDIGKIVGIQACFLGGGAMKGFSLLPSKQ